jgi:flagella synthesis protein FlgN
LSQELDAGKRHTFLISLKREFEAFRQFHRILSAEHTALISGDADELMALAQRKNECVIELTQLAEARNRYLTETVGSTNQIGMDAWLDLYDPADKNRAGQLWRELIGLARTAKELNQTNGQLIHTRLAHNQQALAVLLGVHAGTSNLYGADGQAYMAKPTSSGKPLGKA